MRSLNSVDKFISIYILGNSIKGKSVKKMAPALLLFGLLSSSAVLAQGQDSHTTERDLQVISTMLVGGFDNANQSYFDTRGKREIKHRRIHMEVEELTAAALGDDVFLVSSYWDNEATANAGSYVLSLSANLDAGAVEMRVWSVEDGFDVGELEDKAAGCPLYWTREAMQFRANAGAGCDAGIFDEIVLSEKEVWVNMANDENGDFKMHRIRNFECYADIPGVGGGRDVPYERYDDMHIHDQGGAAWFTSKDGRKLGITLFLVDWQINNYEGIFTRDSFVIYVSEEIDGEKKEHGYAFTVPEVDRLGINLKWMLASCFMKSNEFATPAM